jgi:predicted O-methyltransferase YrrM
MGNFIGGSAFAMANQIADGHLLLNIHHLKRLTPADINVLKAELDKILRETRSEQPPLDQIELLQKRNRKISRINNSMTILKAKLEEKKRAKPN